MLRVCLFIVLGLLLVVPATPIKADWHSFWNRVHVDTHRNNCWPMPFQRIDRESVCQTLSVQLANGWRRQNTLTDVYFDRDTQMLNVSGRLKLYSILSGAPEQYRTVYVVQSMNPEAQQRRVASIKTATEELFGQLDPDVVPVSISPRSWSAEYIDSINRQVDATLPAPRLPAFESTTSN